MSILFKDWIIHNTDPIIARQYDKSLVVTGDLPDRWDWYLLANCNGHDDAILLTPMEDDVGANQIAPQIEAFMCQRARW